MNRLSDLTVSPSNPHLSNYHRLKVYSAHTRCLAKPHPTKKWHMSWQLLLEIGLLR